MKSSIVGLGQTEFSTNSGRSELNLALEAILAVVSDAGCEVNDIDVLLRSTWDDTFTDPTVSPIQASCATADNPKANTGDLFGSRELYDYVANNEAVVPADATTTHAPESFVARKTVVSVNSALEIDLLGQVNAETIGDKQTGSMGGMIDFAVGGQVEGGHFVLGLRSRTNSRRPRIVTRLDGHIVTLSRTFVETVVTEYGIAELRNKSVHERALALAAIAHPDDREMLLAEAENLR